MLRINRSESKRPYCPVWLLLYLDEQKTSLLVFYVSVVLRYLVVHVASVFLV
jgi:hypothetical protein